MMIRNRCRAALLIAASATLLLGTALLIPQTNTDSAEIAARYHHRGRTSRFFQRSSPAFCSKAKAVVKKKAVAKKTIASKKA